MITFKQFLARETQSLEEQIYEAVLTLLEDEGPPSVPDLGIEPTPPAVVQPPSPGGGWAQGGPFRPFSGGGKWFGELYGSVKQLAVASKIKARLKQLGIKGVGVDRVDTAYKTALFNVRDLLKNPQKTAYRIPVWTTQAPKKPKIPVWREELAREFTKQLLEKE